MKKRTLIFGITAIMLGMSCREQDLVETQNATEVAISEASVVKGRLYFPNKESLQYAYNNVKNEDDEVIAKYIDSKNIISLRPVITEENEKLVAEKLGLRVQQLKNNKRLMKSNSVIAQSIISNNLDNDDIAEHLDDLEDIIADDAYAAFLNSDAEIQVADKIYKYTDVGLFAVKADKYNELKHYLEDNKISDNLLYPTDKNIGDTFVEKQPNGVLTHLTDNIEYFRDTASYYHNPNTGLTQTNDQLLSTLGLDDIIKNLPAGEVKRPWVANRVGDVYVTHDQYAKRNRVKIKFYSHNLFLAYAIGCKVKHQYRGWTGLWRKQKAEQLGMGADIEWSFENIGNKAFENIRRNNFPTVNYYYKGRVFHNLNDFYSISQAKPAAPPKLPFEKQVDFIIEFFIDKDIVSLDERRKILGDLMRQGVEGLQKVHENKFTRVGAVLVTRNEAFVSFYDYETLKNNEDVIEKIFDWGIATPRIDYTFGHGVGGDFGINFGKFDFLRPKAKKMRIYGIAKVGGKWRGAKLIID